VAKKATHSRMGRMNVRNGVGFTSRVNHTPQPPIGQQQHQYKQVSSARWHPPGTHLTDRLQPLSTYAYRCNHHTDS
jgi:hypothetical protein